MEHGKQFCKSSPTLDETILQRAVSDALSSVVETDTLTNTIKDCVDAANNANSETEQYLSAKRRVSELDALLDKYLSLSVTMDSDADYYDNKCREVITERTEKQAIIADYEANHT